MALKRFCGKQGCKQMVTGNERYCEAHQDQIRSYDQYRGTAAERGYDSKWRKAREGYLRKHPLCTYCFQRGYLATATVVDHITPHRGDKQLFWDRDNWQPLCKQCHDTKTAKEDGGFGNGV
ncbi:HNH endonuclease [Paenibacillus polymyxa]|nr:HNH endonuclease [Paenibacillus polymyxa]UOD87829.1 HNH endonuclease [Paenibacillus polymyxa ATCC 842]MBG9766196.1 HNH endonuclease family protein [Paenibacillus polymyxa]QPK51646.1 HNH endonuclease [Paenibacillus polymyxa]QPK56734.1 HNH endonuclease [Paenibacillus polymyxa]